MKERRKGSQCNHRHATQRRDNFEFYPMHWDVLSQMQSLMWINFLLTIKSKRKKEK